MRDGLLAHTLDGIVMIYHLLYLVDEYLIVGAICSALIIQNGALGGLIAIKLLHIVVVQTTIRLNVVHGNLDLEVSGSLYHLLVAETRIFDLIKPILVI